MGKEFLIHVLLFRLPLHSHACVCHTHCHVCLPPQLFQSLVPRYNPRLLQPYATAPHLTPAELDFIQEKERLGKDVLDMYAALKSRREKKGIAVPHITNFRKVLKGKTYKRSQKETRGRKRKFTKRMVLKMNSVRKNLIKKAENEREVRWADIQKRARAPKAHRTTLLHAFKRCGLNVAARAPRLKPLRTKAHKDERCRWARAFAAKPSSYFQKEVDMIIDNKKFDVPTTERARKYMKSLRVRFHLRTPAEGVMDGFTKPGRKKNRMNTGACASVCAGISNSRIVLWHYLPKRWTGQTAADLYRDVIYPSLRKHRGKKRSYKLLEDNDPTGYKSNKAKQMKESKHIEAMPFPRHSPDLNPLDFSLWDEIERRVLQRAPKKVETVAEYKARLRRTALALPKELVTKAVGSMPKKIKEVRDAKGGSIKSD